MIVSTAERPDVVAIVPTLGTKVERLLSALSSLEAQQTDARLAVVVVVNSDDHEVAAALPDWVRVEVVGLNLGWAGGLAFGRSLVETDHIWLVQDDMVLEPGCLEGLLSALADDDGLGMVAPLVLDENGLVVARSGGAYRTPEGEYVDWQPPEAVPIDEFTTLEGYAYIGSRGMLIRSAVWDEVGGMDAQFYPVVWADGDFCAALAHHQHRFRLVAEARCAHEQAGSTPSRFGALLWHRHRERLERKWLKGADEGVAARAAAAVHPELDRQLLTSIAVASTSLVRELAARFEETDSKLAETWERLGETNSYALAVEGERDEARRLLELARHDVAALQKQLDDEHAARAEVSATIVYLDDLEGKLRHTEQERAQIEAELADVLSSRSWRLSAPLRRLSSIVRRRPRSSA